MITFVHITDTQNTGDLMSGPYRYFDFGAHQVLNYTASLPDGPLVVGGGAMTNWLQGQPRLPQGPKVAWGIGSSRHGELVPWPIPEGFDLVGVRERLPITGEHWAPCASCMASQFDAPPSPCREAVRFLNADPSIRQRYPVGAADLPTLYNDAPFDEIVEFLASGSVVVTDSYHGVYWGMLLGRTVVCVPYSSKHYGMLSAPQYSRNGGSDWREASANIEGWKHGTLLSYHRFATEEFYRRACDLLHVSSAA